MHFIFHHKGHGGHKGKDMRLTFVSFVSFVVNLFLIHTFSTIGQSQTPTARAADPNKYAVIISGASGEEAYAKQFTDWTTSLRRALVERLDFAGSNIKVLTEMPADGDARATADEVQRTFQQLAQITNAESRVFIFFIGHGTFSNNQAKFNLVGPDLPIAAYSNLIDALPARRVVVINMASASGAFLKPLQAKGRIVITATRSGQEQNATRFGEHFIRALEDAAADADKNKRISVAEAYDYAARATAEFYTRANRLATEHAALEDGGTLARTTYFDSMSRAAAESNAQVARLLVERERLEEQINDLISRKSQLPANEYEASLERLFIDLAKLNRSAKAITQ